MNWLKGAVESLVRLPVEQKLTMAFATFATVISCVSLYLQFYRGVTESFRVVVLQMESPERLTVSVKLALVNAGDRQLVVLDQFLSSTLEPGTLQDFNHTMLDQGSEPILLQPHEVRIVTVRGDIDTLNMLPRWQPAADTSQTGAGSKQTRIGLGFWLVTAEGGVLQNGKEIATLYVSPNLERRFVDYEYLPKVIELKPTKVETPNPNDIPPRPIIDSLTITPR